MAVRPAQHSAGMEATAMNQAKLTKACACGLFIRALDPTRVQNAP